MVFDTILCILSKPIELNTTKEGNFTVYNIFEQPLLRGGGDKLQPMADESNNKNKSQTH